MADWRSTLAGILAPNPPAPSLPIGSQIRPRGVPQESRQVLLNQNASVTLDGSGNGTAKIGPASARETWYPQNVHVSANANPINEAGCNMFVGDNTTTPSNFRDNSISGSTGDSSDRVNADVIKIGHYVFAVWTNGDAGAIATVTVTGTKTL
jgi:hypothetical protein